MALPLSKAGELGVFRDILKPLGTYFACLGLRPLKVRVYIYPGLPSPPSPRALFGWRPEANKGEAKCIYSKARPNRPVNSHNDPRNKDPP